MKAVILAGGYGSRLSEETELRPKPMVSIGEYPILWHIMKIYSSHGINDFIICLGYKGYVIKEYFANYFLHSCDVTFDFRNNEQTILHRRVEPWRVTLVDTGMESMTGGRLKAVSPYLDGDFCFTYGDGVGDVDVGATIAFHLSHGRAATMTVARPPGRFGEVKLRDNFVESFAEKQDSLASWVNAGFFVLKRDVISYIDDFCTVWEQKPLERLATEQQLEAFRHSGFWQPMDTVRDRNLLQELWTSGRAPWKVWD
jgi:glucose-1-phosphate cytidylyltransferase